MAHINTNFTKLPGSYLFAEIAQRAAEYTAKNPDKKLIRLGIGDVTQPIVPEITAALHVAVNEMATKEGFMGYGPYEGYEFLRKAMAENDYKARGCDIEADEIFISDGAKSDSANILEIFANDSKIAVCDPVYPVYVDANAMAGRTGIYEGGAWSGVIYMPCLESNNFLPQLPKEAPDLIYLCFPNNPTGAAISKSDLQAWVDYANKNNAVIIYDAAYEAYISEDGIAHSIFECANSRTCAIELRSFSKNAGFTGVRLGAAVIPKDLVRDGVLLHSLWTRRIASKFNGVAYIVQKAGAAAYSKEGRAQIKEQIAYYMKNAAYIYNGLKEAGYTVFGGVNAPYIWLKTPNMSSWQFFDSLLNNVGVIGTPGSGFGATGEGYFRLTAFGSYELTVEAIERIKRM